MTGDSLQCPECSSFTTTHKAKYLIHQRKHKRNYTFKCDLCDYRCTGNCALIVHKRKHTNEKPFMCSYCDYTCAQLSQVQQHHRIHTGERPYACDICDYRGRQLSALLAHQRLHAGVKPYTCDMCDYAAVQLSTLRSHIRSKHPSYSFSIGNERVFYCQERCKFSTHRQHLLDRHMQICHNSDASDLVKPKHGKEIKVGLNLHPQLVIHKTYIPSEKPSRRGRPRKHIYQSVTATQSARYPPANCSRQGSDGKPLDGDGDHSALPLSNEKDTPSPKIKI